MYRVLHILGALVMTYMMYGQQELGLFLENATSPNGEPCVTLYVQNEMSGSHVLSNQNYRLFYNSEAMDIDNAQIQSLLPSPTYQLNIAQHSKSIQSGHKQLPFHDNMGFLNLSVVHNDISDMRLRLSDEKLAIVNICYTPLNSNEPAELILARNGKSDEYGRAYSEIWGIGEGRTFVRLPITDFMDYKINN